MSDLVTAGDAGRKLAPMASRERAVGRVFKGAVTTCVGFGTLLVVNVADVFALGSTLTQRIAGFGAALLIWTGCIVMASGTPHLVRFGGRLGVLSLSSFGAAGISGLLAVAEMFESFFLDSTTLQGLDKWGLGGAVAFFVMGKVLMDLAHRRRGDLTEPREP